MQAITLGCDPEVWLHKNGVMIPCVGLFPGSKGKGFPVEPSAVGLKIHEDNVTLEFNINPSTPETFRVNVLTAKKELLRYIRDTLGPEYEFGLGDTAVFTPEQLNSEQAKAFGCDPDQIAYMRGDFRKPPSPKLLGQNRCAGGHVHIGYNKDDVDVPPDWAIVQGIEAFAYMPHMRNFDRQGARREWYGVAGLYRSKPYGLEYRVPSNGWLREPEYAVMMGEAARQIISKPAKFQELYQRIDWEAVATAVNNNGNMKALRNDRIVVECSQMYDELVNAPEEK